MLEEQFFLERSKLTEPKKARKKITTDIQPRSTKRPRRGNIYSHTKTGIREDFKDLNIRSSWEVNCLRVLRAFDIRFAYEQWLFQFPVSRGNKAYLPDIWLPSTGEHLEIKGFLSTQSKTKLKRFALYFPDDFEKLTMIISKYNKAAHEFCNEINVPRVLHYEEIRRLYKDKITNWEGV